MFDVAFRLAEAAMEAEDEGIFPARIEYCRKMQEGRPRLIAYHEAERYVSCVLGSQCQLVIKHRPNAIDQRICSRRAIPMPQRR